MQRWLVNLSEHEEGKDLVGFLEKWLLKFLGLVVESSRMSLERAHWIVMRRSRRRRSKKGNISETKILHSQQFGQCEPGSSTAGHYTPLQTAGKWRGIASGKEAGGLFLRPSACSLDLRDSPFIFQTAGCMQQFTKFHSQDKTTPLRP
ncbi:hypothetical protein chiPu_0010756 [Chiloscyllium punctatum]|uniref:Uncharacterized protein n=1 Tax=Chiloscyllium punctatum TaxID=137246 RepID=A0A401SPG3_CHIPU|nr:hypothetical protein [Chiloscyllium punctatum]